MQKDNTKKQQTAPYIPEVHKPNHLIYHPARANFPLTVL